ncbi:MAG: hypothetical protein MI922_04525 [Bacteroidales bacterium]|nr:hypothetical protein [Bacteroidales bacterium]
MQQLINKTIESLKARIKTNLEVINKNQGEIKAILGLQDSPEKKEQFERMFAENKKLLAQNNDFINIQLTLINFVEKYKNTAILEEDYQVVDIFSVTDDEEIFELTCNGMIEFDENHPRYDDEEFFGRLLTYYEENEEYEKCQRLLESKSRPAEK